MTALFTLACLLGLVFMPNRASGQDPTKPATRDLPIENGIDPDSRKHAWPSEGPIGEQFRDVAKELRCPTCTGLSILESDARFSVQIKDLVKEQVEAGKDKQEILKFFTERYGPWILRSPPKTGFNVLAWALPIGMMLIGPVLIWFFVWRKRRVITSLGVRPIEEIVDEMNHRLEDLRKQAPKVSSSPQGGTV
jgi:cytochrome c-type biogenesis protein CcmH/NrfF